MQIDIPQLMDYMREKSLQKGYVNKKSKNILAFHKAFLTPIKLTGRSYEIGLVAGYKARTFNLFQDLDVAPSMFLKGKLPILPEMIKGKKQMSDIFSKTKENKANHD
jgi:heterodisulfide reductase subunit C